MAGLGAWSLLPPLVAIAAALLTRRVHQSLLWGLFLAGVLFAWQTASGPWRLVAAVGQGAVQSVGWIVESVASPGNAAIFVFLAFLAGTIALMQRAGAVRAFGEAALGFASSRRRVQVMVWSVGATVLAIDDHFNVIASGTMFRPVTDRLRVSRQKLAYLIDSTGAPVAIVNPVSTWAGFMAAFATVALAEAGVARSGFATFLASIPYNFYAWFTLAFVLLVALGRIEFGPMLRAERQAMVVDAPDTATELDGLGAHPAARGPWHLLAPLLFLLAATLAMLWATGHEPGASLRSSFHAADPPLALSVSTALTLLFCVAWYRSRGFLGPGQWADVSLQGVKAMVPAFAILALAFSLGTAVSAIGLPQWTAQALQGNIGVQWMPLAAFAVGAGMSFATGTSFGTYAIVIPLTLGITAGFPDAAAWYAPVLGATAGGGVFGDHCSPISDTTVLSSIASGCDHVEHVRTQLPYALGTAALAALAYAALGMGGPLWLAWVAPLLLLGLLASRPPAPALKESAKSDA